jgi:hypothetical protein
MAIIIRGHFDGKAIIPGQPVDLPHDRELEIEIRVLSPRRARGRRGSKVTSMPFFGMWADREDMRDSAAWVRKERRRWTTRVSGRR